MPACNITIGKKQWRLAGNQLDTSVFGGFVLYDVNDKVFMGPQDGKIFVQDGHTYALKELSTLLTVSQRGSSAGTEGPKKVQAITLWWNQHKDKLTAKKPADRSVLMYRLDCWKALTPAQKAKYEKEAAESNVKDEDVPKPVIDDDVPEVSPAVTPQVKPKPKPKADRKRAEPSTPKKDPVAKKPKVDAEPKAPKARTKAAAPTHPKKAAKIPEEDETTDSDA